LILTLKEPIKADEIADRFNFIERTIMKLKALHLFIFLTLISVIVLGQTPGAFKYQAVVRDATGMPIVDTEVNIRIGIYSVDAIGPIGQAYVETHLVNTNGFGLVNLEVGNGLVQEGIYGDIPWGRGEQYIEVAIDVLGGDDFTPLGSSQILAVPMASYAAVAGNVVDTSIYNEIQHIDLEHTGILTLSREGGEVDLSIFNDSAFIKELIVKASNDSLYFEGELDALLQLLNEEVIRATEAELGLADDIVQNAVQIFSDSIHFQNLIDNLSAASDSDSLYFADLIEANTQRIINDSAFLKSLIDQNAYDIQQEITRAILSEAINAGNIATLSQSVVDLQIARINDSTYFQGLLDQNTDAITAEITRAILAELINSNNIALNAQAIAINTQNIYDDSISFQGQLTQMDIDLQEEITRAIYRDQVNSDSIQIAFEKLHSDSIHFQTQINGLSGGGLDPTLENGKIFVGNAAGVATGVNLSGDAQISNTGNMMISPSAITTAKVADGNITNAKLSNSSFTISDDQGNSGQLELGNSIQFQSNGATQLNYNSATHTMEIASSDNQVLNVSGNNLSISSGNIVDLSAVVGQVGPQGPSGPQGATGPQGAQGLTGPQGIQGPQGAVGPTGPAGANGVGVQSTVNNGDGTFTITYTDGSTFTSADLTGPQGIQGITGAQGIQGATGPAGTNGVGVQSTVNNGNGTFTIIYTDGSTFTSVDLTGPTGPQGPIGPQGAMGPSGSNGVGIQSTVNNGNGTFTITYTDGSTFTTADFTGPTGAQGPAGPQGVQGNQGATGPQGVQGIQGVAGTNGISVNWLGTIWPAPEGPSLNDAYRNPVDKKSYIWDGSAWRVITVDGVDGAVGPQGPTGPQGETGTSMRECPAGGWSEINEEFCIEVNERTGDTWWNAAKTCGDLNAHLCSWNEWYYVCQKSGSGTINMTNDWEWTMDGIAGGTPKATVVGDGSCTNSGTNSMSANTSYRCCFSR
jgi:hypothetical protein